MEAADLSWHTGDRISQDRLALWISLRLSGVQDDTAALARAIGQLLPPGGLQLAFCVSPSLVVMPA